jgi:ABC-type Na+ efflux pump permease subunit
MDKVIAVAVREFLATVRTRAFLLTVVFMPGLIVGGIYGTRFVQDLAKNEQIATRTLAVVDPTGMVFEALTGQIQVHNAEFPNQPFALEEVPPDGDVGEALLERIRNDEIYGYVILPADALEAGSESKCELARRDNQLQIGERIEAWINEAVFFVRCQAAEVDFGKVVALRTPVQFQIIDSQTGGAVRSHKFARIMTPFAFMFLLFMGTFGISQGLLTTVIEEKSSRVVEVLLSAVSPMQLMTGKILGTAMVGLLLLCVWGGIGLSAARTYDVSELVTGYRLLLAALYFLPGFLLMASILGAIGAACNELKEAQSMVFPISILTIIPMLFWFYIAEHPASIVSVVLSYVPPITPFIMILRVCSDPDTPLWQIVSTLAVLWAAVIVAMWAAGKIFRIGVLMYGKPPTPGELLRWVRYS